MQNAEGTIPPEEVQEQPAPPAKHYRGRWILGGVLFVLLSIVVSGLLGYRAAIHERLDTQTSQIARAATTQFELAQQDITNGRLEIARQRLEYVIKLDPKFPGASDKLSQVVYQINVTSTPTPLPTPTVPTPTPTLDPRPAQELFDQVKQYLASKDWSKAIDTLDSLRKQDVNFKTVDVDGMYYVALRYRGQDKILQEGKLEEGLYDLALAERFGPLDGDARGYRTWANLYLTGASFWQVDWGKSSYYFGQVYPYFPGLRDSTGMTATERFRLATIGYADQLESSGDHCNAQTQYETALQLGPDPAVTEKANKAAEACAAGQAPTPAPASSQTTPSDVAPTTNPEVPPTETPAPPATVPTEIPATPAG